MTTTCDPRPAGTGKTRVKPRACRSLHADYCRIGSLGFIQSRRVELINGVILDPRDCLGKHATSARLVVEVIDSTRAFDRLRKAALYARSGIAYYWILNPIDRQVQVHRRPELTTGRYFTY
jgi:Uma2 family endonuclease